MFDPRRVMTLCEGCRRCTPSLSYCRKLDSYVCEDCESEATEPAELAHLDPRDDGENY